MLMAVSLQAPTAVKGSSFGVLRQHVREDRPSWLVLQTLPLREATLVSYQAWTKLPGYDYEPQRRPEHQRDRFSVVKESKESN